jgi:hypothetical protein
MEGRALLTSAAVSAAIASIQQAETQVKHDISVEISTLKANIVTIQQATSTFISGLPSGDKTEANNAVRDEKFAIGQQNFLIKALQQAEGQYNAALNNAIGGLNKGKLDPVTVPGLLDTAGSNIGQEILAIDSAATYELSALTGTFATGNT